MDPSQKPPAGQPTPSDPALRKQARVIPSEELFAEQQEVHIEHAGETYRLRKTRAGKLILTK